MLRGIVCGLAALLALACGLAAVGVRAQDPADPLTLELQSSRNLCTAGTPTEISWQIAGGVPPYTLSVEGEPVDADAESHRINCGALTEAEAADADAALAAKQITATVTDSRGVQREASLGVARARALPAPMTTPLITYGDAIVTEWLTSDSKPDGATSLFLIRWRPATSTEWSYRTLEHTHDPLPVVHLYLDGLRQGIDYRFEFAAMRDQLDTETPAALPWSRRSTTTLADPTGLSATATHNTVTVTWDAQPAATFFYVDLDDLSDGYRQVRDSEIYTPTEYDGEVYTVVFRNVPPDHAYTVRVQVGSSFRSQTPEPLETTTTVRTTLPPSGWTAPHRGAQRVRSTATTNSITVTWDAPYLDAAEDDYHLMLFHPTRSGIRHERVYNGTTTFTFDNLEPGLTYRVVIDHIAIVQRPVELDVATLATSAPATDEPLGDASARQAPPPFEWWANGRPTTPLLYLKLTNSRDVCTAGTLTELSWQIAGGVPPYMLSVEGEPVDADAESHRINCGALTEAEAADEEAALAAKRVIATVTDSRGVQRQASLDAERARPLPPPPAVPPDAYRNDIVTGWTVDTSKPNGAVSLFLARWRPAGVTNWTYKVLEHTHYLDRAMHVNILDLHEGVEYRFEFAAMRDQIETDTPDSLIWIGHTTTTLTSPPALSATATHDTVTVTWARQASAIFYYVVLAGDRDHSPRVRDAYIYSPTEDDDEQHSVTFRNVPPDTEYTASVQLGESLEPLWSSTTVRTSPAPAGWTAPLRGAQNTRATATTNSITVTWDAPYPDAAEDDYHLMLFHPTRSGIRHERVYNGATTFTFDNLEPGLTYRVVIDHIAIVQRPVELDVATLATSAPALRQAPLFEWWADGRPATPLLYLKLTSSRELCTAGTLTELSWQIAGGVPPYTLTIDGSVVDIDADNIRINCGALPHDPRTGELAASRTKTFRGSLRDSRGVTTTATAPVTLITPLYLAADTALRYETYDLTGAAASVGSYAFLTDATSAASVVTTYEGLRDGSAGALLIHTSDAQGVSRATLYAAVAAGDLFEWRESHDCWVRYRVTEVRPDPPSGAARKLLGVEWTTYAFTGCNGAIATDAAILIAWGPLPDLGGPSLAAPLRHGPYQLVPEDWTGPVEEDPFRPWPGNSFANPVHTAELAEARRLPYWRDPKLPAGWTFSGASSGASSFDPPHGYCSYWQNDRGYGGVEICGGFDASQGYLRESSSHAGGPGGIIETRMIDGRSSLVMYSPAGPKHNRYYSIQVRIYDPISDATYLVRGLDWTLNGSNVDAVIEIARSLFTTAAPTAGDAASAGASGNRDALPFVELTLQREGSA